MGLRDAKARKVYRLLEKIVKLTNLLGIGGSGERKGAKRYRTLGQVKNGKEICHYGKWRKEKSKKILGIRASGEKKRANRFWALGQVEKGEEQKDI